MAWLAMKQQMQALSESLKASFQTLASPRETTHTRTNTGPRTWHTQTLPTRNNLPWDNDLSPNNSSPLI